MPRQDKTGPEGMGPGTGRGLGRCFDNYPRRGRGFFRKNRRFLELPAKEKKEILKEEIEILKEDLKEIKDELTAIDR